MQEGDARSKPEQNTDVENIIARNLCIIFVKPKHFGFIWCWNYELNYIN